MFVFRVCVFKIYVLDIKFVFEYFYITKVLDSIKKQKQIIQGK